ATPSSTHPSHLPSSLPSPLLHLISATIIIQVTRRATLIPSLAEGDTGQLTGPFQADFYIIPPPRRAAATILLGTSTGSNYLPSNPIPWDSGAAKKKPPGNFEKTLHLMYTRTHPKLSVLSN